MTHLPKLSFLFKSAPTFNSRFRHSRFLVRETTLTVMFCCVPTVECIVKKKHVPNGWKFKTKAWMLLITECLKIKQSAGILTHPPAAAAWRQVLPKSSGVSMSNPGQICNQHQLGCQPGDSIGDDSVSVNIPEDSSFLQQSEKPLRAVRCRGNIPWMPLLKTMNAGRRQIIVAHWGQEHFWWRKGNKRRAKELIILNLAFSVHQIICVPYWWATDYIQGEYR